MPRTIRVRLTLWYGALFLLTGFALLAINYLLVRQVFPTDPGAFRNAAAERAGIPREAFNPGRRAQFPREGRPPVDFAPGDVVDAAADQIKADTLRRLLLQSTLLLAALSIPSLGLGWLMAGRMLRPIAEITATARRISDERLHERVALDGPPDELKELADQFDVMLGRLQQAFEAQRSFVANAAHELRTPLTVIRTELDVSLDRADAPPDEIRETAAAIRRALDRAQALIDALLMLARADSPAGPGASVELAGVTRRSLETHAEAARARALTIESNLSDAYVFGDRVLLEGMVDNLVTNAIAHNRAGGWIRLTVEQRDGAVVLSAANSGDAIGSDEAEALFERFARRDASRSREGGGYGLGLSIVRAVAEHHAGTAVAIAVADGGLEVRVELPRLRTERRR
ncbi:MAG: ATP-binding protein [Chloroflexi bacterium]|nr:ATP-binding protein [Chloroflexota bacterium]MDA1004216.1 ATP-binding protein [Chloroflexota bacterium]